VKKHNQLPNGDVKKLLLSFLVFLAIVLAIIALGLFGFSRTQRASAMNNQTYEIMQQAAQLRSNIDSLYVQAHRYDAFQSPDLLTESAPLIDHTNNLFEHIKSMVINTPNQVQRIETVRQLFTEWVATQIENPDILLDESVTHDLVHHKQWIDTNYNQLSTMYKVMEEFVSVEQQLLEERQLELKSSQQLVVSIVLINAIILISLFALMTYGGYKRVRLLKKEQEDAERSIRATNEKMSGIIEATNVGTWVLDLKTGYSEYNDRWAEIVGYTRQEIGDMSHDVWRSFIHPDDIDEVDRRVSATLNGDREFYEAEFRMHHKNGSWIWIMDRGKVIARCEDGTPLIMSGTHTDITASKEAARALAQSEETYRRLVQQMNQGLVVFTLQYNAYGNPTDLIIESANNRFAQIIEKSHNEVLNKTIREIIPIGADHWIRQLAKVAVTENPQIFEISLPQHQKFLKLSAYVPEENKVAAIVEDISAAKTMQNQLWIEKGRLETTLLSVGDAVISTDAEGKIVLFNIAAENLTGWRQELALQKSVDQVFIIEGENIVQEAIQNRRSIETSSTAMLLSKQGQLIAVEAIASPIFGTIGSIDGVVVVFRDNSEKRKQQQIMEKLGFRDALTGVRNRRAFDQEIIRLDKNRYYPLILVVADVNNLKLTNDAFGHEAGDELLKTVAKILINSCRDTDIVARIGGDEFVLLLPNTDAPYADTIIDRINATLEQHTIHDMPIAVSFGHAIKLKKEETLKELFREAENSMYRRKISERPRTRKYIVDQLHALLFKQNPEEFTHAQSVSLYCQKVAQRAGMSEIEIDELRIAGFLHDIGKVALSSELLANEGLQDEFQGEKVLRHPEIGFNILSAAPQYAALGEIILAHHERVDGLGYPSGLEAAHISLAAKILAVCDFFAIMTDGAPAGMGMKKSDAIEHLKQESGNRFDSDVVALLIEKISREQKQENEHVRM
jgi:diguanylate cyclase (GGDEF)-like protein/PAS domain S-box-containing protein